MLNAIRVTYSSVCPPSQPIIVIITRSHLISPEPQSSAPAPHLILITPTFISTSTRAFLVQSRSDTIGLTHCFSPLSLYIIHSLTFCVIPSVLSSSSVLLIACPSSSTHPGFPAVVPSTISWNYRTPPV